MDPEFLPDNIPESLKSLPRWSPWYRYRQKSGKWAKAPSVSVKERDKWCAFDEALKRQGSSHCGLGLLMTGYHDVIGIDLDGCLDERGRPEPWAREVIRRARSYTEVSPSRRGVRILLYGSLPNDVQNHEVGIEAYNGHAGRFLTITGDQWPGSSDEVVEADPTFIEWLFAEYDLGKASGKAALDVEMPDLLEEEVALPEALNPTARAFLEEGRGDDRSEALHWAAASLIAAGLSLPEVLTLLAGNDHAMAVALDHRRQDEDRALLYLWQHHVVASKDTPVSVAEEADFLDLSSEAEIAVKRLALLDKLDYEQVRKDEAQKLGMRATVLDDAVREARKRAGGKGGRKGWPDFVENDEGGIICNAVNTTLAVECAALIHMVIGYDEFRDEIMWHSDQDERKQWQAFRDQHYNWVRIALDRAGFERTTIDLVRSAVDDVAHRNRFDTAKLWLTREVPAWDGVPRVTKFHARYLGCLDSEWADAVSEYLWTAMVGRIMEPGCQADMMPVWISDEGKKKSTIIATMVPSKDFTTLMSFHEKEIDLSRKMRGRLLVELAELSGMAKKEVEGAKAWITKRFEDWTPKFKEFNTQFPRRFVLIGTTNEERFLISDTGNRRFLPLKVSDGDDAAIARDRDQLWAEALTLWQDGGVRWEAAHSLGKSVVDGHMVDEPWAEDIGAWLYEPDTFDEQKRRPIDLEFIPTTLILSDALRIEKSRKTRGDEMRVSKAMRQLGFVSGRERMGDGDDRSQVRGWRKDIL